MKSLENGRKQPRTNANVDVNANATRHATAIDDAGSTNANEHARNGPKHDDANVTARIII